MIPYANYDRAKLDAELIRDEGLRLKVYRCTANKLSCGVGRNLDDVGISAAETATLGLTVSSIVRCGISRAAALALLDNDVARCEQNLDAKLPWWRRLDPVRQRVILNMCFNMGIGTLLEFRNTLRFMAAGAYADAAKGMLASRWADQVGARAVRLAAMMKTGKDPLA